MLVVISAISMVWEAKPSFTSSTFSFNVSTILPLNSSSNCWVSSMALVSFFRSPAFLLMLLLQLIDNWFLYFRRSGKSLIDHIAFVETISVRIWENKAFESPISQIACREFLYDCQNIEGSQCPQWTPCECVWRNMSAFRQFLQLQLHTMYMLWSLSMCARENSRVSLG